MPLRDHFTKATPKRFRWEGFHSQWAGAIVRYLNRGLLPSRYHAEPRIRLGAQVEVDVGAFEEEASRQLSEASAGAVAIYSPPGPGLIVEADLSQEDLFEVQVFDDELGAELVAAVELISPRNKDRAQSRHDFVVKCASMLKAHVSLILIDIVTSRHANLFDDLMDYLEIRGLQNPLHGPVLYCCSLRPRGTNGHAKVEVWPELLHIGASLPRLPLWLGDTLAVPLELEATYEETCGDLRG